MTRRPVAPTLLVVAAFAAAAATRLPAAGWMAWAVPAAAAPGVACGVLALWGRRSGWSVASMAFGIVLLALPTSTTPAWATPAPVAAALMVVAFHVTLKQRGTAAPSVAGAKSGPFFAVVRFVPVVLLLVALAVLPTLGQAFLPDRLSATFELQGAAGPLLAFALLLPLALAWTWGHLALQGPPMQDEDAAERAGEGAS